jgi:exopolysaccharide production protein ExoZ
MREPKTTFAVLQAGRAVAALLVVLFHASDSIYRSSKGHAAPFGGFFTFGHAGVHFFFVLSGFVMLHVHRDDIGFPRRAASYAWKRIRRIYPLYWIVLVPVIVAYLAIPGFGKPGLRDFDVIVSSVFLVHFRTYIIVLYVAWTLFHEVLFYVLFGLLILHRRIGTAALGAWFLVSLMTLMAQPEFSLLFWSSPLNLLFAMGMAVAWVLRRGSVRFAAPIAGAGALMFAGAGIDEVYLGILGLRVGSMLYGLGAAMTLAGMVSLEREGRVRIPGVLRLIGDASYSIYLVHLPVLSLLAKTNLQKCVADAMAPTIGFMLMAVLAVVPGLALHLWVERPMLHRFSARRPGRVAAVTPVVAIT